MKVQITESRLHNLIKESIKKNLLLLENEGTNMKKARRYLEHNGYSNPQERQNILDAIRTDIPNSRLMDCYYLLGVTRLYVERQLDNQRSIANLNTDLKYIASDTHCKEYDSNLNNMSLIDIHNRFKTNIDNDFYANKERSNKKQLNKNTEYKIVRILDFETAQKFGKYTSWCVTHDPNMYNSYTHNGSGLFYFCLKNGFKNVRKVEGEGCPLDEYGLSMIAVSVDMQGEMNTITCRWNHDNNGNDSIMTVDELENLLGVNFYQTFKPYSKEELIEKGVWISEKIGELYDDGNIRGIIASVDKNDEPRLIMSLNQPDERMTWDEAMVWGKRLTDGWHIPSSDELEEIWKDNGEITKILNRGLKKYNGVLLDGNDFYWSSSEYSSGIAYNVDTYRGLVRDNLKLLNNCVRAVVALS